MQPTQLFIAFFSLFVATAMAAPAPAPVSLEARGFTCDFLGAFSGDACNALCKQEGNGKGGHCVGMFNDSKL
jgi:hypothetical protein